MLSQQVSCLNKERYIEQRCKQMLKVYEFPVEYCSVIIW